MRAMNEPSERKKAVGVYIIDGDGRLLLTQRGPKARHEQYFWEGPGGEVDADEDFESAAVRELQEELSVTVKIEQLLYEIEEIFDAQGTGWHAKVFIATTVDKPCIQEPEKCIGYGWFTLEQMSNLPLATYAQHDLIELNRNKEVLSLA